MNCNSRDINIANFQAIIIKRTSDRYNYYDLILRENYNI